MEETTIGAGERSAISAWNDRLDEDLSIAVLFTDDPVGHRIRGFADALAGIALRVHVSIGSAAAFEPPAIVVGDRLRYLAAPSGTELAPFLEAVRRFGAAAPGGGGPASGPAQTSRAVRVYVSSRCPHCPVATRELLRLPAQDPSVTLTIIDADLFPELVARDRVRSVPTVLVGRHYRSTGTVSVEETREALTSREPGAAMLGKMLDGGDADAVADMMVDSGRVFPAVLDRLGHDAMSVRLGAMAALERVIETAPEVARSAESGIWERVDNAGTQAAGDLIYVIGEAGTSASMPRLAALRASTTDEDIREAVTDAMARIVERTPN